MYKLVMYFNADKDVFDEGLTGETGACWDIEKLFDTIDELKAFVKDETYSGYDYIEQDEDTEGTYRTAYTTTDDNMGEMNKQELEDWKAGKINGWYVDISFTVDELEYTPLPDIDFKETK